MERYSKSIKPERFQLKQWNSIRERKSVYDNQSGSLLHKIKNVLLIIIVSCFITINAQSQYVRNNFEQLNDSIECLQNISVYRQFLKLEIYDKAITAWQKTYLQCKGFKKLIYQDGVKLIKISLKQEKDQAKIKVLVDSLMKIYDERIIYFGQEGYVRGRQGIDLFINDKERAEEAHKIMMRSLELRKDKTEAVVIAHIMLATDYLHKKEKIEKEIVVETYLKCVEVLDNQERTITDTKMKESLKSTIELVENIFARSKAADCEGLKIAFESKFNENKEDSTQVLKIQSILKGANCSSEKFFLDVTTQLQKVRPTAENAFLLAGLHLKSDSFNLAINYLKEAIKLETYDSLKAVYYHDMGFINCHKLKNYPKARANALEALKLRPKWGNPYILIGDVYANSIASYNGTYFEKVGINWLVVDKYQKAKAIDPEAAKYVNSKIAHHKKMFPKNQEVFMQGYKEGQAYQVGGWINETTTVRVRENGGE